MNNHHPEGYFVLPRSNHRPAILVLHAWWGLNETIKAFCRRLAETGFSVFAPDLYHGRIAETIEEAESLSRFLEPITAQTMNEISTAARFLYNNPLLDKVGIAVVGFSLGAYYALKLAASEPDHIHSVVLFYGTGEFNFRASKAAYLGHFAEDDPYEPQANVDSLENALTLTDRSVTFYRYPGTGHWFFEPDRTDAYNPIAADLAWSRTIKFLRRTDDAKDK